MDEALKCEIVAFLPRLRRFAHALTGSRSDGDDLVQATCERAIRHLDARPPGSRLDAWLFRIARKHFLDDRRAHRVRGSVLAVPVGSLPSRLARARLALKMLSPDGSA